LKIIWVFNNNNTFAYRGGMVCLEPVDEMKCACKVSSCHVLKDDATKIKLKTIIPIEIVD